MNGIKTDPSEKPVFEPREITLSGWVEGDSWEQMKENFNAVMIDLTKAGTQRLICDAYGKKTIVCDVKLKDGFPLLEGKTKEGKNIGVFTLKLVEENPIKKILYTENSNLQLSFLSPKMVTVNIDGKAQQAKGNIVINKTLPARVILGNYLGRNLILQSKRIPVEMGGGSSLQLEAGGFQLTNATEFCRWNTSNVSQGLLTLSFKIKRLEGQGDGRNIRFYNGTGYEEIPNTSNITTETIVTHSFRNSGDIQGLYMTFLTGRIEISWLQLESGNKATDWTPAPEEQHYISIAGNIDEITNLNTNAAVLWEILL
ncbi:TPA: galactose-binding protein [Elizabethkingia anophelis]